MNINYTFEKVRFINMSTIYTQLYGRRLLLILLLPSANRRVRNKMYKKKRRFTRKIPVGLPADLSSPV